MLNLALPISFVVFKILGSSDASNLYNAIGRYYGWQQMPTGYTGNFFGFQGCTRSALEYTIKVMRSSFALGWYTSDSSQRKMVMEAIAEAVSAETGADEQGILKFENWVYSAAKKDADIYDYLSGGKTSYTFIDDTIKNVSETVSTAASNIAETVDYGVSLATPTGTLIENLLPVAWIAGAAYIVKQFLD